ncbi:hypothetical protein [Kitasatospora sp. NBC_01302]|uniref:hypothetical protein n=1 Tax=Kitasatospora sp. NBC_01302 TaxID=2903575 RepID=UPI002E1649F1|nr:hypothetical protein OG294_01410 [Kitasatospora sp. NBC_01302]
MQPLPTPGELLTAAFPADLADDVQAVLAVAPAPLHRPVGQFSVLVRGEQLAIPERIYNDEPPPEAVAALSLRQRRVLHCLYSRHCDGRVRQRHLAQVLGSADPWVIPFVVQLVGEYVLEILVDITHGLRGLGVPGDGFRHAYSEFIVANPAFFARTQRRVVSYWSCYYRNAYQSFQGYPGCTLVDLLRSAAAAGAGRPWPSLAPKGSTKLHGYC